jgi:hypothetical protein
MFSVTQPIACNSLAQRRSCLTATVLVVVIPPRIEVGPFCVLDRPTTPRNLVACQKPRYR